MEVLQTSALPLGYAAAKKVERETGFEPATSTLARLHSTTELLPLSEKFFYASPFRLSREGRTFFHSLPRQGRCCAFSGRGRSPDARTDAGTRRGPMRYACRRAARRADCPALPLNPGHGLLPGKFAPGYSLGRLSTMRWALPWERSMECGSMSRTLTVTPRNSLIFFCRRLSSI